MNRGLGGFSPFRRMKNAIAAVFIGILMIPGSVILLGWNEWHSVNVIKSLNETLKRVTPNVDVTAQGDHEGELIHFATDAKTDEVLSDDQFKIAENAIKLRRRVETYQWIEDKDEDDDGHVTYSYSKEWSEAYTDSSSFAESGYKNVPPRLRSEQWRAKKVAVGVYELSDSLVSEIENYQPVEKTQQMVAQFGPPLKDKCVVDGEYFYFPIKNASSSNPDIGDQRIQVDIIRPQEYSFISQVSGKSFRPFVARNGFKVELVEPGNWTVEEMIRQAKAENATLTWILRLVGFVVCFIGICLVFGPITTILDYIPLVGQLAKGGIMIVAFLISVVIAMFTIAISWIAVRPMVGIPLLLVGVASIVGLVFFLNKNRQNSSLPPAKPLPGQGGNFDDDQVDVM